MDFPYALSRGAVSGVIGSYYQLLMGATNSLLACCGLFQEVVTSPYGKAGAGQLTIDFSFDGIEALVDIHGHIDGVSSIPYLLAASFKGAIICSESSSRLLLVVWEGAFELGVCGDQKQVQRYLKLLERRIGALPYKYWLSLPVLYVRIHLQRAGHILGWAYIEIELFYPATGLKDRIVSSCDLGAPYAPILPAPKAPYKSDVLVIESTYDDSLHENRRTRRQRLEGILAYSLSKTGKGTDSSLQHWQHSGIALRAGRHHPSKGAKAPLPIMGEGVGKGCRAAARVRIESGADVAQVGNQNPS